jgi:signal transduction histidine kinase
MSVKTEFNRAQEVLFKLPLAVLAEDEHRKISFANHYFCDLFAIPVPPHALIGLDCANMAQESKNYFKVPEKFLAFIDKALALKQELVDIELALLDGRYLAASYMPYFKEGAFAGHIWTYKDITVTKNAELALEKEKEFSAEMLEGLPADIAIFDKDHRYVYLNKTAIKDKELRKWIIGKDDFEYCEARDKDPKIALARREKFIQALQAKEQIEWEDELTKPDGSSDVILRKFNPLYDNKGAFRYMIGYGVSITKQKQAEKELIKSIQKERELNELQTRFVNMVSHEIRTPMAGILSSVDLLELITKDVDAALKEKTDKHLERIKNQINRVSALMNDVLLVGKTDAGKIPFKQEKTDILALVNELLDQPFGEIIAQKKVKIHTIGKIRQGEVDQNLLKHILGNLLSNAFKYSVDKPLPEITIEFSPNKLNFKIQDFGIGIPLAEQKQLFTAFMRASNSGNIEGTGLGLVVVKNFVAIHNGKISFKSAENKGSTFEVSIPA